MYPMPYVVPLVRYMESTEVDAHGVPLPGGTISKVVPVAGWAVPMIEYTANPAVSGHVAYDIDVYAKAGEVKLGDVLTIDGWEVTAVKIANYDKGPFGFQPGLDVVACNATEG